MFFNCLRKRGRFCFWAVWAAGAPFICLLVGGRAVFLLLLFRPGNGVLCSLLFGRGAFFFAVWAGGAFFLLFGRGCRFFCCLSAGHVFFAVSAGSCFFLFCFLLFGRGRDFFVLFGRGTCFFLLFGRLACFFFAVGAGNGSSLTYRPAWLGVEGLTTKKTKQQKKKKKKKNGFQKYYSTDDKNPELLRPTLPPKKEPQAGLCTRTMICRGLLSRFRAKWGSVTKLLSPASKTRKLAKLPRRFRVWGLWVTVGLRV